jgi:hydrogenase maturation protein HypF
MPGGEKAIREPWRMAAIYLHEALGADFAKLNLPFNQSFDHSTWVTLRRMVETRTNSPETSSMGRLFDAVSSLVGLRNVVNYEGQAAVELEAIADKTAAQGYEFELSANDSAINAEPVIRRAVEDLLNQVTPGSVSARFHLGVAQLIASVARRIREERRLDRVVLSGGVFQNLVLLEKTCRLLRSDGFEIFTHRRVPPNDGGISLGQVVVANARLASRRT